MEERSLCSQQVCSCRSSRLHSRVNLWSMFLSATCILLLAKSTSQAEYTFISEPSRYYYIIVGQSALIPCAVEVTRDDGTVEPVSPTLTLNSEPLDIHDINEDTRIFAALTHNVVVGLLILDTQSSDPNIVFECAVREGNETLISMTTNIYIDNGLPLKPVSSPVPTSETVHSITVDWGEARTPTSAPITHYTIILVELLETEREILFNAYSNNTNAEVTGLLPNTMYRITVVGVNQFGEGQRSNYEVGQTASSLVPLPPISLSVDVQDRGDVCDIIFTWTPAPVELDVMTQITNFVIYYGRDEGDLMNFTTADGQVTRYNMSGWRDKGEWIVGVASINSAGVSAAVYMNLTIELPSGSSSPGATLQSTTMPIPTSSINLTTIVAIAGGCFVFLIVILIILITICVVRQRIKTLSHEQSFDIQRSQETPIDELDGSPSMKKKTPSPKRRTGRESDCSYTSTELQSYPIEPRIAGSRTPPPVDV